MQNVHATVVSALKFYGGIFWFSSLVGKLKQQNAKQQQEFNFRLKKKKSMRRVFLSIWLS